MDNGALLPHVALFPAFRAEQETVTALAGIVGQELKAAGAMTFRFQDVRVLPVVLHVTTAEADALTTGEVSGLMAVNVNVAGETAAFLTLTACGLSLRAAGAGWAPGWAAAKAIARVITGNISMPGWLYA